MSFYTWLCPLYTFSVYSLIKFKLIEITKFLLTNTHTTHIYTYAHVYIYARQSFCFEFPLPPFTVCVCVCVCVDSVTSHESTSVGTKSCDDFWLFLSRGFLFHSSNFQLQGERDWEFVYRDSVWERVRVKERKLEILGVGVGMHEHFYVIPWWWPWWLPTTS